MRSTFAFVVVLCSAAARAGSTPKHFIVIKRGLSGSTWLTTLLLNFPRLFVLDEAIASSVVNRYSSGQLDAYLKKALREPMGKIYSPSDISWSRQTKETKSCFEDKGCGMQGYGVGLAPLYDHADQVAHGFETALENVARALPGLKVLLWIRTNVVKMALSSPGQKQALQDAGESHGHRSLSSKVYLRPDDFVRRVNSGIARNKALLDHFRSTPGATTLHVYYEAMQRDTKGTMLRVAAFLGVEAHGSSTTDSPSVKKHSENMRNAIQNFEELEALLQSGRYKSDCILQQLRAQVPMVHPLCSALGVTPVALHSPVITNSAPSVGPYNTSHLGLPSPATLHSEV